MDTEMLHRLDDLRSGMKSLLYGQVLGFCSNFCSPELLIVNKFEYSFTSINLYKSQFEDPIILEGLQTFETALEGVLQLNRQNVEIQARQLGIRTPVDKRTVTYMNRMLRHRYERETFDREVRVYQGEDQTILWGIYAKIADYRRIFLEIVETITQRADELIAGRTIPPRYYHSDDSDEIETFDESELPPFVQNIVYPYGSKPEFEYVDPPEPEPERDNSKIELGDQRTKDFARRAYWEPTEQAIRTLRGALRFGRTGLNAHRAFSMLGELYERQGLYEKALEHYTFAMTSVAQPYGHDYADRGRMHFRLGHWAEAKADFMEALRWRLSRETWEEIQMSLSKIASQE